MRLQPLQLMTTPQSRITDRVLLFVRQGAEQV